MPHHTWSIEDDIVAFYLYKFDPPKLPCSQKEIVKKLGISIGSMNMRILNFQYLAEDSGLENYSRQSEKVYKTYRQHSESELRQIVMTYLGPCP